ncbi:uncharacterized protein LOC106779210 [Vigna radiata var. radiata]|uniref:Uncharacterized protein LOC106779210 n=1 Tax=Vigna radiata var. radiata TaxID=3916 RepID=A0A1S3VX53_VIGRR|nr:uncharacterized protein LOC106779210 [Vigna radiata var. radiata]
MRTWMNNRDVHNHEGEGDEGLVDVDVNVDEVLRDNIEGVVSVEVSENEESGSEGSVDIAHNQKNPYDRGLSDDEWESEFLANPDESGSEDSGHERQSYGSFGTFVMQKSMSEYKWEVGTKFRDKNEFMDAVRSYAVHGGKDLKFIKNDNKRINEIRSKALRKWNTNVTLSKARRAKIMASEKVESGFKNQFKRIHDYAHELLKCNPRSTVQVKVDSDSGLYKGELLTAIGRDPNDQMLPLAYTIVEVENKDSWT